MSNLEGDNFQFKALFKSLTVLGGTSVLNSIITVIRVKLIAVIIGPYGIGLTGIYTSSLSLVRNLTEFGIGVSAVKDVANASDDEDKLGKIVLVVSRLLWFAGLLGTLLVFLFASSLSQLAFEDSYHAYAFRLLSIVLLFNQLASGKIILIQGLNRFKLLAKSQLGASLLSLIITVPLYYLYKEEGIVPALIITSIISYLTFYFYSRRIVIKSTSVSWDFTKEKGGAILKLGVLLSLSILLSKLVEYAIRIYISRDGGIADVGLYQAGFSIVNTYVAMFFASLMSDFYPRLSKNSEDINAFSSIINDQTSLLVLIVSPVLIGCLYFSKELILILYSKEFLGVLPLVYWLLFAMFIKCISWLLGYLVLAKNDSKIFLYTQIFKNIVEISLSIWLYSYYGLTGLGISFLLTLLLSYLLAIFISYRIYKFRYTTETIRNVLFQLLFFGLSFIAIHVLSSYYLTFALLVSLILSSMFSYKKLDKKLQLSIRVSQYINRFFK